MMDGIFHFVRIIAYKIWPASSLTMLICILIYCFYGFLAALPLMMMGFAGILYNAEDLMLYFPDVPSDSRVYVPQPSTFQLPYENLQIRNKDGIIIHMFFIKQPNSTHVPTILFFHGNAGNMGHRLTNIAGLYNRLKVNILMMEYRGYGLSEGRPSENGIYKDAQLAIDYLHERLDIDHKRIIIFGRSLGLANLTESQDVMCGRSVHGIFREYGSVFFREVLEGGAVAIDLVSRLENRNRIWCLIVENTFTSIPDMALVILGWRWLQWMPILLHKNKYMSALKVSGITAPSMFICGSSDALVPPKMGKILHSRCAAVHKKLLVITGGGHNDTWTRGDYYPEIQEFISQLPNQSSLINNVTPFFDEALTKQPKKHSEIYNV